VGFPATGGRNSISFVTDREAARSTRVTGTMTLPAAPGAGKLALDFDALYRSARDDVFSYVATLLRDRGAAEDVTALAFERAYRRRGSYDPRRGSRRAWLFGIARNATLDELRRRRRHAELTAEPVDESAAPADQAADVALRRAALRTAMGGLSGRERELIALKFFAGLSNPEIATVVGISDSNAGTRLHRVIEKLRRACDEVA
jgi:RNA polymerase sigma-70 factor, ECF subfamily